MIINTEIVIIIAIKIIIIIITVIILHVPAQLVAVARVLASVAVVATADSPWVLPGRRWPLGAAGPPPYCKQQRRQHGLF